MNIQNLTIYTTSACLYLACAYGSYNLVSVKTPDPVHQIAATITKSPEANPAPSELKANGDKPQLKKSPGKTDMKSPVSLDVLAERADAAGIDVGEWSDLVNKSIGKQEIPEQLQAMTTYAAQAGIDVKNLSRLAGNQIDSSKVAPQVKALEKMVAEQTGDMNQLASGNILSVQSVSKNIKNVMANAMRGQSTSRATAGTQNIQAAKTTLPADASNSSAGPSINPDDISNSIGNLQANVNTISSVPDAIKDAISQSGITGQEVDPNQYFAGKPKVGETSGGTNTPPATNANINSMADNLQLLAAAGKGLADMAGNLAIPQEPPETDTPPDPTVQKPAEQIKKPDKPVEIAKALDALPKIPKVAKNKFVSFFNKHKAEMGALGVSFALILYLKITGRKKPKKNQQILKTKYEKAHQAGLLEDFSSAQRIFIEIIKEYPEELDARLYLGGILWRKLDDPKEALIQYKTLEKAIAKQSIDYRYKDKLIENIEKLTAQLTS